MLSKRSFILRISVKGRGMRLGELYTTEKCFLLGERNKVSPQIIVPSLERKGICKMLLPSKCPPMHMILMPSHKPFSSPWPKPDAFTFYHYMLLVILMDVHGAIKGFCPLVHVAIKMWVRKCNCF